MVLEIALYGVAVHALVDPQVQSEGQLSTELNQAGVRVRQVTEIEPTLEDVFISLIRAPAQPVRTSNPSV